MHNLLLLVIYDGFSKIKRSVLSVFLFVFLLFLHMDVYEGYQQIYYQIIVKLELPVCFARLVPFIFLIY